MRFCEWCRSLFWELISIRICSSTAIILSSQVSAHCSPRLRLLLPRETSGLAMAAEVFNPRAQTMSLGSDPAQQQPEEEQFLSTFFCRALFDYQTDNDSSLSFRRDDIIEVLTRLESGWWDGLLGQERGWFPSNYVTVISDQEADAALAAAEAAAATQLELQNPQATLGHAHNFSLAHSQNLVTPQEWDPPNAMPHGALQSHSHTLSHTQTIQPGVNNLTYPQPVGTTPGIGLQEDGLYPSSGTQSSDFWVPQVSMDGRVSLIFPCSDFVLRLSSLSNTALLLRHILISHP